MSWREWAFWYAELFGLATSHDGVMLTRWVQEVFIPQGYSPDDLHAAGLAIARGADLPRFREQHLERLNAEIGPIRAARLAWAPMPADCWSDCKDCEGTGLVSVPTPTAGRRYQTCAVICSCVAGKAFAARTRPDWMTLAQYEKNAPDWRVELQRWADEEKGYQRARGYALEADRTLGAIVQRLAGRRS